jgi:Delta7-sterol 5-desaturase
MTSIIGTIADSGGFALLWAVSYVYHLSVYLALGGILEAVNRRNPGRRIQKQRLGEIRRWRDIRQSVVSIAVPSGCLALGLFLQHAGATLMAPLALTLLSGTILFAVTMILFDAWFYWAHRFMHTKPMYRFHALHHRALAPTAWSTYNDSIVDSAVMYSYYVWAPIVLPLPPDVLMLQKIYHQLNGILGHSGHEYVASSWVRKPFPFLCAVFHDQHHSGFRYNYGNTFSIWDRLMGTLHPGYDDTVGALEEAGGAGIRLKSGSRPGST